MSVNGANRFGSNGPLRCFKAQVYKGGTRVPRLISYPQMIPRGSISHQPMLTMDILTTLLDIIDKKPQAQNIDGISLKNHFYHGENLQERTFYYQFKNHSFIRHGDWKLVRKVDEEHTQLELYNLTNDLSESSDVSEVHTELVQKLNNKLTNLQREVYEGVNIIAQ